MIAEIGYMKVYYYSNASPTSFHSNRYERIKHHCVFLFVSMHDGYLLN